MAEVITKTELAGALGVSKARVSQYVKAGLPVRPDGRLDREAALAWVKANVVSGLGGWSDSMREKAGADAAPALQLSDPAEGGDAGATRSAAEAELAEIKRDRARLALEREQKQAVAVEDVESAVGEMIETAKSLLLLIPDNLADQLAASHDPAECRSILVKGINDALAGLERKLAA